MPIPCNFATQQRSYGMPVQPVPDVFEPPLAASITSWIPDHSLETMSHWKWTTEHRPTVPHFIRPMPVHWTQKICPIDSCVSVADHRLLNKDDCISAANHWPLDADYLNFFPVTSMALCIIICTEYFAKCCRRYCKVFCGMQKNVWHNPLKWN